MDVLTTRQICIFTFILAFSMQFSTQDKPLRHRNPTRYCFVDSPKGCISFAQCCMDLCRGNASILCYEKGAVNVVTVDRNAIECKCGTMKPGKISPPIVESSENDAVGFDIANNRPDLFPTFGRKEHIFEQVKMGRRRRK
uniref:Uncharacterized protein n=1 Tax=Romanomermis culicivorax TaxID=13658 RepID=A0A915IF23_ROMCU